MVQKIKGGKNALQKMVFRNSHINAYTISLRSHFTPEYPGWQE
jgi:hypothetical protein